MAGRLKNRTALVTGANRGIGLAIAQAYAREGANVLLAGRNKAALDQLRDRIATQGGKAEVFLVELEKEDSVRALARAIKEKFQTLDILVGNGASLGARLPLIKYPLDTWRQTFRINVEANLILLAELDEALRRSDAPRVIMLSANVATQGKATTGSYAVSKAALEAIVRVYVAEAGPSPVRINIVSPGATRTEMRARAAPQEDPMTLKTPEDIAPLFVEMASPEYREQGKWVNADDWLASRAKAKM
jgi:NAD(P)-dependent dehydrogenase (short-subunit alcohol dehydrogenase family)